MNTVRHFQWRKTTSCSLDQAMLFDVNIYPRDGHNITALQMSLPSVESIQNALNRSFVANGIEEAATGQIRAPRRHLRAFKNGFQWIKNGFSHWP